MYFSRKKREYIKRVEIEWYDNKVILDCPYFVMFPWQAEVIPYTLCSTVTQLALREGQGELNNNFADWLQSTTCTHPWNLPSKEKKMDLYHSWTRRSSTIMDNCHHLVQQTHGHWPHNELSFSCTKEVQAFGGIWILYRIYRACSSW